MRVHRGSLGAYLADRAAIHRALAADRPPEHVGLYIAGHSLAAP